MGALADLFDSESAVYLHICGVGCSGDVSEILESLKHIPKDVSISWYAGNEYSEIIKAEAKLSKTCQTHFAQKATAKIIRSTLNLKRSESLLLITEMLEDTGANKVWRTELHRTWANRIEASNYRFYFFSDDSANDHTMRALAENIEFSRDIESLIKPFLNPESRKDFPLGSSKEMAQVREMIGHIGPISEPALILGPTGSGKDVVARSIHKASERTGDFIPVNCAVLGSNPQIAESRLFGYVQGAFTGANENKRGAFLDADGGTLFLDEIGELSLEIQAHLLRVLDNGLVVPVGSTKEKKVDVRIVAATHRNLHQMVLDKEFREDLLYRLNVLTISVPPLHMRPRDMRSLSDDLAQKLLRGGYELKLGRKEWEAIDRYEWPGNVRQFLTVLRRAVYMKRSVSEVIEDEKQQLGAQLDSDSEGWIVRPQSREDILPVQEIQTTYLKSAFEVCNRNITHTAQALGITPNTLRKYLNN